jgi:magnesium transporter
MKRHYNIADQHLVEAEADHAHVTVYSSPDEAETRHLTEELTVDEHTFSSALDPDELSRLEFEPDHVAIIFKRPKNYSGSDQFFFKVGSVGTFLFKDRVRVVMSEDVPLLDGIPLGRVLSPADFVLKLIARSVTRFREHLKGINMVSDELQKEINKSMENKHLLNMFTLQKSLVYYVNAINSNGALLEKLKNNTTRLGFTTEETDFLDDLLIENNQCFRQAEMYSNILAGLMDARVSIVSNNLNVLMKTLNIITIAIMVPTLVVSVFSMNVSFPLRDHPQAFWFIVGLAGLSASGVLFFWRKHRL